MPVIMISTLTEAGADVTLEALEIGAVDFVPKPKVDVTEQFLLGAQLVLKIAEAQQVSGAYLKSGSPSCGAGEVVGVTAALLKSKGIPVKEF